MQLRVPDFEVREVVLACAATMQDRALANAFVSVLPTLEAAERAMEHFGQDSLFFLVPPSDDVNGIVTKDQMRWLYENSLVRTAAGRPFYDAIKIAPRGGICPLCKQRVVGTVDHYLPQAFYARLTVAPINLIPACEKCNFLKRDERAMTAEQQTLHPYFDSLPAGAWLHAEIQQTTPPAIVFRAQAPGDWSPVLQRRVERHFAVFGLAELYASQAASELVNIAYSLVTVHDAGGPEAVRQHLQQQLASREYADPTSWQAALYRALSLSEWFHAEGHARVLIDVPAV